ncbi:MAG TPA: lipoyl synthase [Verrucomicrobia bacterium]|nr:lipoyl synthase [Verrucomicrobiota bacterium]
MSESYQRKPDWLRVRLSGSEAYRDISSLVQEHQLHTVCQSAMCPNIHECWGTHKTATFMILGNTCTRACRFCAVDTGVPPPPDLDEPARVAGAVAKMGIRHAVITMVTRDDLADGGSAMVAATVNAIREASAECTVEVLVSDMNLNPEAIHGIADSHPEINSHNLETVRSLTATVRSRADYDRSLTYLRNVKAYDPSAITKSSLMLGLGETRDELLTAMDDLRHVGTNIINLGQYLQPTPRHTPVVRYWHPDDFDELREQAMARGFDYCQSGPLVRSSYHAGSQYSQFLHDLRAIQQ